MQPMQPAYPSYGGFGHYEAQKPSLFLPRRRHLNWRSVLLSILIPWGLFCAVHSLLSFHLHFLNPTLCWFAVFGALALVLLCGFRVLYQHVQSFSAMYREPNWITFLFLTMLMAWLLGVCGGIENFESNMLRYYNMHDLQLYENVDLHRQRGQAAMDAGVITFSTSAYVDVQKDMAFNHLGMFCVAPVSADRNRTLGIYDFWAVGKDCCSTVPGSFHCGDVVDPRARSGLRILADEDAYFYRLAVQKAEAKYDIKSLNPIFFEWVVDAPKTVTSWADAGVNDFLHRAWQYGVLQTILVIVAAVSFSRLQ
eukprot:TRINITY_DN34137_c0_g3_i1.p1 TRINITY_DN34137_c0_g3~~TRINITY_DN34137_c0_g3_i1.p1  ORF type:complete len:309 (-),score=40.67 TRINITY_DN34137_c0_g3_i1:64-990(-)